MKGKISSELASKVEVKVAQSCPTLAISTPIAGTEQQYVFTEKTPHMSGPACKFKLMLFKGQLY